MRITFPRLSLITLLIVSTISAKNKFLKPDNFTKAVIGKFAACLPGPTGATGATGHKGDPGTNGTKGPTGATGSLSSSYASRAADGTQVVTTVPTNIDFNTAFIAPVGISYNPLTKVFTATTTGVYSITHSINVENTGVNNYVVLDYIFNGTSTTQYTQAVPTPINANYPPTAVFTNSFLFSVNAGDTFSLAINSDIAGTTITIIDASINFFLIKTS
jgi:hypothetical protein